MENKNKPGFYQENDSFLRVIPGTISSMNYVLRVENSLIGSHLGYGTMLAKYEKGEMTQLFADLALECYPGSYFTFRQDVKSGDIIDAYFVCPDGKKKIISDENWHHQPKNDKEFYYTELTLPDKPKTKVQIGIGSGLSHEETIKRFGEITLNNLRY